MFGDTNIYLLIIIAVTAVVTLIGFSNRPFFERFKFCVGDILGAKQWDRMLTSAFLHVNFIHVFFNLFTLYNFAPAVISLLGSIKFLVIYFSAILAGNSLSLWMHRKEIFYSAVGASGGVAGVLFASIVLYPHLSLMIIPIPIPIPGWLFGVLYLIYSIYGMQQGRGNIGHEAHLGGAATGLLLALIYAPEIVISNGWYVAIMLIPIMFMTVLVFKK